MMNKIKKYIKLYGPLVLLVLVLNLLFLHLCKIADNAYNNRACNAGYYNTLPEEMKDHNFTCDR